MKRVSARAIIPMGDCLVLIRRIRETPVGTIEYHVFPGGGMEEGETLDSCVVRGVVEEVGIHVRPIRVIYELHREQSIEVFMLCEYLGGKVGGGRGPEYHSVEYLDRGRYVPGLYPIHTLADFQLLPEVRSALVSDLKEYGSFNKIPKRVICRP